MSLVSSFCLLVQPLSVVLTAPSFQNLLTILCGWVFAPRRTVTGMILAAPLSSAAIHISADLRRLRAASAPGALEAPATVT